MQIVPTKARLIDAIHSDIASGLRAPCFARFPTEHLDKMNAMHSAASRPTPATTINTTNAANVETNPFIGLTYGQSLRLIADRFGEREALVMDGRRWTFHAALAEIDRASARLLAAGFRPGDKLALWMPNRPEFLWYWLGAAQIGMLAVVINTRLKGQEVAYQVAQSDSRAVIVPGDGAFKDFIGDIASFRAELPALEHVIALDPTAHPDVLDWSRPDDTDETENAKDIQSGPLPLAEDPEAPALISYSSGTTGLPKGALIAHSVFRKAWDIGMYTDQTENDRLLLAIPLFGSLAMMNGVLPFWTRGGAIVVMERFTPQAFLDLAAQERCTMTHLLPPMIVAMEALPHAEVRSKLATMRTANVVSLDHSIFRLVTDKLGIPGAIIGYGLTESTTVAVRNRWDDPAEARMTSQGHPLPGIELRIVDPETGAICGPGTPGEIQLRGYCIMKGYYNKPEETRQAVDTDGWFHTGDFGVVRDDGRLSFLYRYSDGYKTNGFNISPSDVEAVVRQHPDVVDTAVFGQDDPVAGQVGVACVVLSGAARDSFDEAAFLAYLREHLPSYKVPRHVVPVESLPVTAGTGKVQKFQLRKMVEHLLPVRNLASRATA